MLEHPGPYPLLDVVAAATLEHDRLDALAVQELREREACRAGADDADLRPHQVGSDSASSSTCWAIANARFAAGTPQ